ncbi:AraC family transcriptional regulator [Caballeronia udeis]|uniref:AraC family transcriptional regulator n=1 Tax=Caballeronia udeis TaxID=1232866 RepID=A0A158EV41_9BURK|nr:helix-turn-helix domain-containing protein [Caballeronia udeis]SAL11416.1 AraC family transcriptional regulator [Caballeronia udeis]
MPQHIRFESTYFKEDDAEEIWREALRPMYDVKRPKDISFAASVDTWDLGPMLLTRHAAQGEVQFHRTRRKIALSGINQYLVHCLVGGQLTSEFAEGQQRVPLNSVAIRDLAVENIGFAIDAPMITLSVARSALDRRLPQGSQIHGASWAADDAIGELFAAHMHALARLAATMTEEQMPIIVNGTLDLLAACLLPKAQERVAQGDPRLAPMLRAQAASYIEQHLLDPDLGPAALCKALGISRTALYELFAESGESGGVAKRIKDQRLDEALRRLTSPKHARQRVAEVAYSVGFASDSTFSRAFKERFGCTPNEARGELFVKLAGAIEKMPDDLVEQHQRTIRGLSG